jgi:hypothetical protein
VASPAIILFLLPIFQPANGERASPSCPPDAPAARPCSRRPVWG